MVFQDPHASLNPAMTIEQSVGHPLQIHGIGSARATLAGGRDPGDGRAGTGGTIHGQVPLDASGGQKRRRDRTVILNLVLLVADEPVSMLDMSVRAKILELMLDLKREFDLTYLYITHDLATAKFFWTASPSSTWAGSSRSVQAEAIYADPAPVHEGAPTRNPRTGSASYRAARPAPGRGPRRSLDRRSLCLPPALPGRVRVWLGAARPPGRTGDALGAPGRSSTRPSAAVIDDLTVLDLDCTRPA